MFAYNGLTNAAREGARLAIVNQDKALIGQRIQANAPTLAISNLGNPNDLVSFYRALPNADPTTNAACTDDWPSDASRWSRPARAGKRSRRSSAQIIGPINFVARSEIPVEFVCPNAAIPAYATSAGCPKQP